MHFLSSAIQFIPTPQKPILSQTEGSFSHVSHEKLPKIGNFSTSHSLNNSILDKVKTRKNQQKFQVDPVLAATVVKKYLLPMFEKSKTHQSNLMRKQELGLKNSDLNASRDSTAESSVFKELKLSERLLKELENVNLKLVEAEGKQSLCEQEKFELQSEIDYLKDLYDDIAVNYESCKLQLHQYNKNSHTSEMKYYFMHKQFEHYKKLYQTSEEKIHEISEALHRERNSNDIRLYIKYSLNS